VAEIKKKYKLYPLNGEENENYIDNPKYGYRAHHFIVEHEGRPIEVQGRTKNQTRWADWAHETIYKNKSELIQKHGQANYDGAVDYSNKMSNYYYEKDLGNKPAKPAAPEFVKKELGELPA
jgi:ppGpp synthetase/RelA/SpoT-type nucleotidyltranferase